MNWTILESSKMSAVQNMARDRSLLEESEQPTLHFYQWNGPSATYGYFIKPEEHLNAAGIEKTNLQLAQRPTGGGIIFHLHDLAFSVWVPVSHPAYSLNTLDNYAFVNTKVAQAIHTFSGEYSILLNQEDIPADDHCRYFCMAKPTKYDVILNGRKVGGGAQRRTKRGFLHQGSINLGLPDATFLDSVLLPNTCVHDAMLKHSCLLLNSASKEFEDAKTELKGLLIHAFTAI